MSEQPNGEILLYNKADGTPFIEVRLEGETVWLSQQQIAELFGVARTTIVEHIHHVYEEGELEESATCRNSRQVRIEGTRKVSRDIPFYNLDVILSVGYRVKSATATRFRIWATERLRDVLVKGYSINQQRLNQIGDVVRILGRSEDTFVSGSADILASYLPSLDLLHDYDVGKITSAPASVPNWKLTLEEAREIIASVKKEFPDDDLFGSERGNGLEAVIGAVYQGFAGQDLYFTVEEKAANLLYLVVKDHPLTDGNKRSAAALFITFLAKNEILKGSDGRARISNNALASLTLMVSMSNPKEKALMISLLTHMLSRA